VLRALCAPVAGVVAVILAVPTPCAVTTPLLLTETTLGFEDVHVICRCVALVGVTVAKSGVLLPRPLASTVIASTCEGVNEAILTDETGTTAVTTYRAVIPFTVVAVITAEPGVCAVGLPLVFTETILGFDDVHVIFLCASRESPCALSGVI